MFSNNFAYKVMNEENETLNSVIKSLDLQTPFELLKVHIKILNRFKVMKKIGTIPRQSFAFSRIILVPQNSSK